MATKKRQTPGQPPPSDASKAPQLSFVKTQAGKEANRLIAKAYDDGWAHARAGKPVAWVMYGPPRELLAAFDVLDLYPESYAANCAIKQQTSPYIEYAEEDGFSDYICGYIKVAMGYCLALRRGEPPEKAAFGGMANPTMRLSSSRVCDPRTKVFETMRRYLNVPAFIFDHQLPPSDDKRCMDEEVADRYIDHFKEGCKELTHFLERETGKKLDIDRLDHLVRNSVEAWHLFYESFDMRKNSPCPLPWEDLMVAWRPFRDMAGEDNTVRFYRNMRDEMKERIRLGIPSAPGGEKYRLMWLGLPMWFDLGLLDYAESLGAVVVVDTMFHPTQPRELKRKDTFGALAEKEYWSWDMYGYSDGSQPRVGSITGSHIVDLAREYKVDGAIAHTVISCRSCTIGNRHIAKVLREDMGIPFLGIESHMTNLSAYSPMETRERVNAFIQVLEGRK